MKDPTHSPSAEGDRIAKELARLGEPPASAEELGLACESTEDLDVSTVATLFAAAGIAGVEGVHEPLSPLSRRRVWKHVEGRLFRASGAPPEASSAPATVDGRLRAVIAGLAVAAGVALMARLTPAEPVADPGSDARAASRTAIESLAEQARRGVEALDGPKHGARAEALAEQYAARLRRGGSP